MNAPRYLLLVLAGLVLVIWGLTAAHSPEKPRKVMGSLAVIAGVLSMMAGALLVFLPRFFLE